MVKYAVVKTFYASEYWQKFRTRTIAERGARCQTCGKIVSDPKQCELDHFPTELTPENVNDATISLNPDNVVVRCNDCHNRRHHRFGYQSEHHVSIVFGAPLSGKTSYVRANMERGDIVIDMDQLYSAVSMLPYYDKPDNLLSNVMSIHNALIDNIKTRYGRWNNAWIIGGYADKYKRERLVNELGAELILCDVSKTECLARLEIDHDRHYRRDEWKGYIDKWFDRYSL